VRYILLAFVPTGERRRAMTFDAVFLSRLQFGFTIAFHIIFPSFTIGLSAWIATLLVVWRRTGLERYRDLARFWTRIFAVSFAMGVVSGIVLSYQFGTNWSRFSLTIGNVVGPLIGYEVLTAFFLESTFLGVMLFGWRRVPPGLHVLSAILVAVGTLLSAFWIISANSWMQVPTGQGIRDGVVYPADWLAVIFSPTFPIRFVHMVTAAYLTTAFVVLATGARYLINGQQPEHGRTMLKMGLGMAVVLAPLQLLIGDSHGLSAARHQPAKIAAVEAHWNGAEPGAFVFFAIPDEANETNRFEIAVPYLGSLLITHSFTGLFPGLKDFAAADRPPVTIPFFAFRLMVGLGLIMIAMAVWGTVQWLRGRLEESRLFLRLAAWTWPIGFIAIISGWTVAEVGRQPWIATGILRTADAASPVAASSVAATLILFVLVYFAVFGTGIVYINRLIRKGPTPEAAPPEGVPSRPITAYSQATEGG
jgi:cytochrome d ubiquinol oxidase subunit I